MRNLTNKETIWHFTCKACDNWWSYATVSNWKPIKPMFCPHCGEKRHWLTDILKLYADED